MKLLPMIKKEIEKLRETNLYLEYQRERAYKPPP
jgi:hypothetical protein